MRSVNCAFFPQRAPFGAPKCALWCAVPALSPPICAPRSSHSSRPPHFIRLARSAHPTPFYPKRKHALPNPPFKPLVNGLQDYFFGCQRLRIISYAPWALDLTTDVPLFLGIDPSFIRIIFLTMCSLRNPLFFDPVHTTALSQAKKHPHSPSLCKYRTAYSFMAQFRAGDAHFCSQINLFLLKLNRRSDFDPLGIW